MSKDRLTYRAYSAQIEFDAEDGILTGRIAGISDVVGFHADTVSDLITAFHQAVDDYEAACARIGKAPQRAHSGKLMLRVDPRVHAASARAAERAGLSLNQWSEGVLARAAGTVPVALERI